MPQRAAHRFSRKPLRAPKLVRHRLESVGGDGSGIAARCESADLAHRLKRRLTTDSARRGGVEGAGDIDIGRLDAGRQSHIQNVVRAGPCGIALDAPATVANGQHVFAVRNHPFGKQKALHQFEIRSWRAHGHGNRRPIDADLQRLLDGQGFRPGDHLIGAEMPDPPMRRCVPH